MNKKNDDLIPKDAPTEVIKEIDTILRIENADTIIDKTQKIALPKSTEKVPQEIEDKTNTTPKQEVPVKQ